NNKAPACESRGFVRKKQKVCILTHLHTTNNIRAPVSIRRQPTVSLRSFRFSRSSPTVVNLRYFMIS
ncbi:hypothetical protein PO368_17095, partial [Bacteroides ovatus]|nr:hypothetical protein [Bacteroides ovatus]